MFDQSLILEPFTFVFMQQAFVIVLLLMVGYFGVLFPITMANYAQYSQQAQMQQMDYSEY